MMPCSARALLYTTASRAISSQSGASRHALLTVSPHDDGQQLQRLIARYFRLKDGGQAAPSSLVARWLRTGALWGEPPISRREPYPRIPAGCTLYGNAEVHDKLVPVTAQRPASASAAPGLLAPHRAASPQPLPLPLLLPVVYVDPRLIVLNKPAGMPSQGGDGVGISVVDLLPSIAAAVDTRAAAPTPASAPAPAPAPRQAQPQAGMLRLAHRLDVHTSGLLLCARDRATAELLRQALDKSQKDTATAEGTEAAAPAGPSVHKYYLALADAPLSILTCTPPPPDSTVEPFPSSATTAGLRGAVTAPVRHLAPPSSRSSGSKAVITSLPATTHFAACALGQSTLLFLLQPLTGRKHQLRQHVAHLLQRAGVGVRGDPRYPLRAVATSRNNSNSNSNMCLHAWHYVVQLGAAQTPLQLYAPLPQHMQQEGGEGEAVQEAAARLLQALQGDNNNNGA